MEIHEIGVHITIPNFISYYTCLKILCFQGFSPFYVILLHLIFVSFQSLFVKWISFCFVSKKSLIQSCIIPYQPHFLNLKINFYHFCCFIVISNQAILSLSPRSQSRFHLQMLSLHFPQWSRCSHRANRSPWNHGSLTVEYLKKLSQVA